MREAKIDRDTFRGRQADMRHLLAAMTGGTVGVTGRFRQNINPGRNDQRKALQEKLHGDTGQHPKPLPTNNKRPPRKGIIAYAGALHYAPPKASKKRVARRHRAMAAASMKKQGGRP